jgi:ribonuclease M5
LNNKNTSNKKLHLRYPVIVEGKYDKIKLSNILSSSVFSIGGFSFLNDTKKKKLLSSLASATKLIILTDSDKAGTFIRSRLKGIIKAEKLINIYIPQIKGKEKRKSLPSKEGYLGVEGQDAELLYSLFKPFAEDSPRIPSAGVSKYEFYEKGLSGKDDSKARRTALASVMGLPKDISANALLEAVNLLYTKEEFSEFLRLAEEKLEGKG